MISCTHYEKEPTASLYKMESPKEEVSVEELSINFNTIDCLNESNQKAIELSSISLRLSKDLNLLKKLLKSCTGI